MSIEIRGVEISQESESHWLPSRVDTGDSVGASKASVSQYWRPHLQHNDDGTLVTSFRGRRLNGQVLVFPDSYKGFVINEKRKPLSEEASRQFNVSRKFTKTTYWNWDKRTSENDSIRRMMDWIDIAEEVTGDTLTWIWGITLLCLWFISISLIIHIYWKLHTLQKDKNSKTSSPRNSIDFHIQRPQIGRKIESSYSYGNTDLRHDDELSHRGYLSHSSNPNKSKSTDSGSYNNDFGAPPIHSPLGMPGKRKQEQQMARPKNILAQYDNMERRSNVPENDNFFY
ncbi:uncharacterized protein LOC143909415 [Arctopsyche grandis]|uniref:uncharacterized protein LOC143909415 n=1 Tax=Arctopsyche grandis TaxID=121162 RepID=UPI00406D8ED6